MRKVKIICTIGPATELPELLDQLIASGMNAARLNFSHGSHESHGRAIKAIRAAAARRRAAVAIIQDLQGPRIRVGPVPAGGIELAPGDRVRLLAGDGEARTRGADHDIPVTYPHLALDVRPGARILIDDGLVELTATRVVAGVVECAVVTGGRVTANKGINLPGTRITAPTVTEKDLDDLKFGLAQGVDYVALSFVRAAEDVAAAKKVIAESGTDVPVIAKIERPEAIASLEAVLEQADGVMIARGDLGVEMGPEAVPLLQKRIIAEGNRRRRLVITATQMLESMVHHPRPTRAEASDVANAVFDGTDAVMLSAETAMGRYPVQALQVMDRIIRAAEGGGVPEPQASPSARQSEVSFPEAICAAAASAAAATGASAIVAFSESGATAGLLAKQRSLVPIIAFTPSESVQRRMALYWGVVPNTMPRMEQTDERVREVERRLQAEELATKGQRIVILSGTLTGQRGGTNLMKLHQIV